MGPHKSINDSTAPGWYGMNMADIRRIEAETKAQLDKERATGEKRGHEEAKEWDDEEEEEALLYNIIDLLDFKEKKKKKSSHPPPPTTQRVL